MKKTILIFALILSAVTVFTSCKETKKEDSSIENHENHNHEQQNGTAAVKYQCPMDCEKGKTYDAAGTCPVCKMDLKPVKTDPENNEQAINCKCTEGEPCTCKEGTCKCDIAVAEKQKDCKMCKPGTCQCKS